MGDTFRERLADTFLQAITPKDHAQALELLRWWSEDRGREPLGRRRYADLKRRLDRALSNVVRWRTAAHNARRTADSLAEQLLTATSGHLPAARRVVLSRDGPLRVRARQLPQAFRGHAPDNLLAHAVVAPIAYLAAAAFALAWVVCMALEWLARYDPARAAGPRTVGNWDLAVDMAIVAAHGWVEEALYVGLAGAAVSAVGKGMWSTVMRHQARPLPVRTQRWLQD
ncbi:hypothetical protein R2B67_18005 [Streptomyces cyaneofuscatus]|uniref:hypothetical protein n=1 Tax=Streptomyces cyaneofuscatus TaxID=66883 RepID=UPI00295420DA|nr:hypothetical protein [Streptomyces cyaneofuscatus]WOP10318.1 hypothetical protein R2B67_18005 [Streptomyces cyaneofuscatus]